MSKILVFGKNGQVGSNLISILKDDALGLDRSEVDLSELDKLKNYLTSLPFTPIAVINAAAYTNVNGAEEDGKEINYTVNRDAPKAMAEFCKEKNIPFVHYSTDYVFDGEGNEPYSEDNIKNLKPLNKYGKAKLESEEEIKNIGGKFLIFRTSWVYNETGKNFMLTMIKLAKDRTDLSIVSDQVGSPTYAYDIAKHTADILNKSMQIEKFPSEIYNLVNKNYASWYEFALKIFDFAKQKGIELKIQNVKAIKAEEYPTPVLRPLNSRLNIKKIEETFQVVPRTWEDALKDCINKIKQ